MIDATLNKINKVVPVKWQWVLNHEGFRRYFKNTGWMFFGRIFSLIISFFVGAYIARYLGPSNYGLFNYVISFVGIFGFLASFGIDSVVSREIIKNHNLKNIIIGTGFYLKLLGAIITVLVIIVVSYFTTKDFFTLSLIWLFSLIYIPQIFNIIDIYFQSQVLSRNVVKSQIFSNIISTILKIICIFLHKGIFWLLSVYVFEFFLISVFLLIYFKKSGYYLKIWKFDKKIAISLLGDSWPLMLSSMAIGLYLKIDQVMIKNMLGNEQSGIYAVAVKISEVWYFIPTMICSSIFPAILNAKKISVELYQSRLSKLYKLMFWIAFFIALPISIFSKNIIFLIFGSEYIKAAMSLSIYVWAGVGVSLGVAMSYYLLTENYNRISMTVAIIGAVINILLNLILIPRIGITGAAISTFVAYNGSLLAVGFFSKTRKQMLILFKSIVLNV